MMISVRMMITAIMMKISSVVVYPVNDNHFQKKWFVTYASSRIWKKHKERKLTLKTHSLSTNDLFNVQCMGQRPLGKAGS